MMRKSGAFFIVVVAAAATGCSEEPCSSFLNDPSPSDDTSVTITFRNERNVAIYLYSRCSQELYKVGAQDDYDVPPPSSGSTCETWQEYADRPASDCEQDNIIGIPPGGSYDMHWTPMVYVQREMPADCYAGKERGSCKQRVAAAPGVYDVTGYAYPAVSGCSEELDDFTNPCICQPLTTGVCQTATYSVYGSGDLMEATAQLSLPESESVELLFQ